MNFSNLISVIKIRKTEEEEIKAESSELKKEFSDKDDFFPTQIFDIKKIKKTKKFKFFVRRVGIKTRIEKRTWIKNLGKYSIKTEKKLLLQFHEYLQKLKSDDELQAFSEERLLLFFEYLKKRKISKREFLKYIEKKNIVVKKNTKKRRKATQKVIERLNSLEESFSSVSKKKVKFKKRTLINKKIDFVRKNVLHQIKQLQLILKGKKEIEREKIFHFLDHISVHNLELFNQEFFFL